MDNAINTLIQEGQILLENGKKSWTSDTEANEWIKTASSVVQASFGGNKNPHTGHSDEVKALLASGNIKGAILTLKALNEKIERQNQLKSGFNLQIVQNQTSVIRNTISLNIEVTIENTDNMTVEQSKQVNELLKNFNEEVRKPEPSWKKAAEILKNIVAFGAKITPDLIKLGEAIAQN